ncbi:MAG: hypothetical protein D6798_05045 [Deltaproteobacteria bacterium]|nr:MAG: hypothetical protein D6798_05045 [Deltaproteobacteria bacterium]
MSEYTATVSRPFPALLPALCLLAGCGVGRVEGEPQGGNGDGGGSDGGIPAECTDDAHLDLYERYVEPLMTDEHPNTCNQCHLSGVDLSMYVRDTPCESMECMIQQGVVDLDDPESSQILAFILQASPDSDLITQEVIQREYDGFLQWIRWSSSCHDAVCTDVDDACAAPEGGDGLPDDLQTPLGGCDEADLVASFTDRVWAWHGRCWSCHAAGGEGRDQFGSAPLFYAWTGDEAESSMLTMYNLIGLGDIDVDRPAESLLLTKPLAEGLSVDSSLGTSTGVYHGGSDKFTVDDSDVFDDPTFFDFAEWIGQYVECRG